MSAKILVTTPNGKVGNEVAKLLLSRGASVRVGAHSVEKAKAELAGAEIVHLDLKDAASVKAALQGISAVYLASPGDWPAEPEENLIAAAKAAGVKKIVKLSAINVEKHDGSALRAVEKKLEKSGLDYSILRPNWFFQNFTTSMAGAVKSGTLAEPAGEQGTAFIDARDIAEVAALALTSDRLSQQAVTLTGPKVLTRAEVAKILGAAAGHEVNYLAVTDAQFREAVKPFMPQSYIEVLSWLYAEQRKGVNAFTTGAVQELLGRPPRSLEEFAKENAAAWK